MVNKQYNIQNSKKSKNRSPPPNRNVSVISNVPNPSSIHTSMPSNSLDSISEENNYRQQQNNVGKNNVNNSAAASEFGKNNNSYLNNITNTTSVNDDYGISDDNSSNCDRLATTTSIHDIGRFQYILQMDREIVSHFGIF